LLVVAGSVTPRSQAQVRAGLAIGATSVRISTEAVLGGVDARDEFVRNAVATASQAYADGKSVILFSVADPEDLARFMSATRHAGISASTLSRAVTHLQAEVVERILRVATFQSLAFFGGETAEVSLRQLGIAGARVLGELHPGVGALELRFADREMRLYTKSGDFGPENLIEELMR
jgi:uncharacterized protein YgbK (DUF1537 family)